MTIAAAAATAAMATAMAQTDIPHSVPQTGAHGSQGFTTGGHPSSEHGSPHPHGALLHVEQYPWL